VDGVVVVVAGGVGGADGTATATVEILYISGQSTSARQAGNGWVSLPPMLAARESFSLCSLNDGTLVAVGGNAVGEAEAVQGPVAEKYTFATNEWTAVQMYGATEGLRLGTASCALVTGGILVAGGCNRMLRPVELVSKFEQSNVDIHRSSSPESAGALRRQRAPRMIEARLQFGLAELVDGRVVAVGGCANTLASSSELYDPGALSWIQVTSMPSPRTGFGCAPLPDGRLLVVGGINPTTGTYPMRNCVLRIPPRRWSVGTHRIQVPALRAAALSVLLVAERWRRRGSTPADSILAVPSELWFGILELLQGIHFIGTSVDAQLGWRDPDDW
jgi:hypothetical protein